VEQNQANVKMKFEINLNSDDLILSASFQKNKKQKVLNFQKG